MADETTPGQVTDVKAVTPSGRLANPESLAEQQVEHYQAILRTQILQKQHRAVLLSIASITPPNQITPLGLTAGAAYSQAQAQQVMNKVDELVSTINQISLTLAFIQDAISQTVIKP